MTETTATPAAETSPAAAKKGKSKAGAKKGAKSAPATHPPTAQMVDAAIKDLNEKGGSSLQAIKKYVNANYKIDATKVNKQIKKYIKASVSSGKLQQTKGSGASGSFRFPSKDSKGSAKPKKKTTVKKAASPKKAAAPKKKAETASTPKKAKSPAKAKKAKAASKPKSPGKPKPKKLKPSPAKPKKVAAKKTKAAKKPAKKASPKK